MFRLLILLSGCGRIGFALATDATLGAGDGATGDGVPGIHVFQPSTDTYLIENSTMNYAGDTQLVIGRTGGNAAVALFQFDVSRLNAGVTVTSASLRLYQTTLMGSGSIMIAAERITTSWDATTVLYATRPTWDTTPLDTQTVAIAAQDNTFWNVTAAVQEWIDGSAPSFGLILEAPSAQSGTVQMSSVDNGLTPRPVLTVQTR